MIGAVKIFLNANAYNKLEDGDLKTFLKCVNGEYENNEYGNMLKKKVESIKHNKNIELQYISARAKEYDAEYKGREKGKIEGKIEVAKSLLDILDDDIISDKTGIELSKIKELRKEKRDNKSI